MINAEVIQNEILDLERRDTTFAVVERLAWLYIVKDHLIGEQKRTKELTGSEFAEACSNVPIDSLIELLSEHFEIIKLLYPKEYDAILLKIKEL